MALMAVQCLLSYNMFIVRLFLLGSGFVFVANALPNHVELLSVVQIFRHGQRTPLGFYPNDPYADPRFWEASPGHLTKRGKFQAYDLGVYTRSRYRYFLPSDYSEKDFRAYTTDVDRTHVSAQAFIAGLYPPTAKDIWHRYLNWNPIPVHPPPKNIFGYGEECPVFLETAATETQKLFNKYISKNKEILEYVAFHSGVNITNIMEVGALSDTLFIENDVGYLLPEWTRAVYPNPLREAVRFVDGTKGFTDSLKRLGNGLLLNTIVEVFEKKLKDPSTGPKLTSYSAHDINLIGLLNTFGYDFQPMFSSSMYFELWTHEKTPFINIYFKNGNLVYPITVRGCDFNCSLEDVKKVLEKYIINEEVYNQECFAD